MRALFYDYALESMRHLFEALFYGWKKTAPRVRVGFVLIAMDFSE
jgi:hypothetical protein